jgi:plasmid stability protein
MLVLLQETVMATLVVKDVPDDLHAALKQRAQQHRRSVAKEVLTMLERELAVPRRAPNLPPPIKLKGGPITIEEIEAAINEGRD